jgi:hypothetical protein
VLVSVGDRQLAEDLVAEAFTRAWTSWRKVRAHPVRSSLAGVKDSLDEVRLDRPVSSITGKARGRRLQRGLSAGAAGGLALGVGLAFGLSGGGQAAARGVHVNLDGFSVNTESGGLVDVTIGDLRNPARLRAALAQAGIPAIVNVGKHCVPERGLPQLREVVVHEEHPPRETIFLLNPAAMPAGAELDFSLAGHTPSARPSPEPKASYVQDRMVAALSLIRDGAKLTCQPIP